MLTVTPELTGPSMNGLVPSKPAPSVEHPTRSEVDAIDLLNTAGVPVLKRLVSAAFTLVLLLIILRIRRRRKA